MVKYLKSNTQKPRLSAVRSHSNQGLLLFTGKNTRAIEKLTGQHYARKSNNVGESLRFLLDLVLNTSGCFFSFCFRSTTLLTSPSGVWALSLLCGGFFRELH